MIEVEHLCKSYDDNPAVKDLSFSIEEGHVYGFLGPNGAGKSTTMNIITGCLSADSGKVTVGGNDKLGELSKGTSTINVAASATKEQLQPILAAFLGENAECTYKEEGGTRCSISLDTKDVRSFCSELFFCLAKASVPVYELSAKSAGLEVEYPETENGQTVDISTVSGKLTALKAGSADDFTDEQPALKKELGLEITLKDDAPDINIEIYRKNGSSCLAAVDGLPVATITRSSAVDLIEALYKIVLE